MSDRYILDGHRAVPCESIRQWGEWFEKANRIVCQSGDRKKVRVSTVFLGLDHSFCGASPLLFETMIFGGEHDQWQERYSTWEQAEEGHKRACALAEVEP